MTDALDKATLEAIREKSAWLHRGRRGEAAYMAVADDVPVLLAALDAVLAQITALRIRWEADAAALRRTAADFSPRGARSAQWRAQADALERCAQALRMLEDQP